MIGRLNESKYGVNDQSHGSVRELRFPSRSKYINNQSFNSSNSLFAKEHEPLGVALQSPLYRLNLEGTTPAGVDRIPDWLKPKEETLANLARIQEQYNTYEGGFAEVPSGLIKSNQVLQPHQGDVQFSPQEQQALAKLIRTVAPPPTTTSTQL